MAEEPAIEKRIKVDKEIDRKVMDDIEDFKMKVEEDKRAAKKEAGSERGRKVPRKYKKRPRGNHAFNIFKSKEPRFELMRKLQKEERDAATQSASER
jgi:hypothetical protein